MSPVSRGRKSKKDRKKRPGGRSGRLRAVSPEPSVDGVYAEMLRGFRHALKESDPLQVEVLASGLLGTWWKQSPPGEDPDAVFGLGVIGYAEQAGTREALGLLRALAVLGTTQGQRVAALAAADRVAAAGVAEPPWAGELGRVQVGDCWRLADVFGDQASLLLTFSRGGRRHGVVVLMDFNHLGGWVKDLFVTADPDEVLRGMRNPPSDEPFTVVDQVAPAEARRLVSDGLAATDQTWQPEVSEEFRAYRALALARARALPEPHRTAGSEPEVSDADREAVVEEFLASPGAQGLAAQDVARFCARLLVDFGADYDGGKVLRVSPAKLGGFLHDWVPRKVVLGDTERDALPAVVNAWARWAGERSGLPPEAVEAVVEVAAEAGELFGEEYDEPDNASPIRMLLGDLDPESGIENVQDVLDRRMFAMPLFGTRIGEEDFPRLDPGDPDERRILIEGEHPEYHAALTDPSFEGEIDGANPRLHIAIHEIVANQLWDGAPPETWQAAVRLRDAGMDRHDILHMLASLVTEQVHGALSGQEFDLVAYRRALEQLEPPAGVARRRGRPGRQARQRPSKLPPAAKTRVSGDAVLQVKVTLRGAKPPIWRRLRLPAAATLDQVHQVIQASFGWTDSHLHQFEAGGRRYGQPEHDLDVGYRLEPTIQESAVRLGDLLTRPGDRISYTYDFGDNWEHDLLVEDVLPADGVPSAVCVTGRRAGPPEDCGGMWGYAELCDILADPTHPEHEERAGWIQGIGYHDDPAAFDPAAFDKDAINQALMGIRLT